MSFMIGVSLMCGALAVCAGDVVHVDEQVGM
jgi:hypothetical protein